jgi:hypothetical protein
MYGTDDAPYVFALVVLAEGSLGDLQQQPPATQMTCRFVGFRFQLSGSVLEGGGSKYIPQTRQRREEQSSHDHPWPWLSDHNFREFEIHPFFPFLFPAGQIGWARARPGPLHPSVHKQIEKSGHPTLFLVGVSCPIVGRKRTAVPFRRNALPPFSSIIRRE